MFKAKLSLDLNASYASFIEIHEKFVKYLIPLTLLLICFFQTHIFLTNQTLSQLYY